MMAVQRAKKNNTPQSGERLIIIKNNIQTALPYPYAISLDNISIRSKSEKKAFAHGGTLSGDGYVDSKKIKISLDIHAQSQKEHDEHVNNVAKLFIGREYRLINGRVDSYYNIASLENIKHKYQKGFKNRWSELELSLLLTDPFRYSANETIVTRTTIADAEKYAYLSLLNTGSIDTPLIVSIVPNGQLPSLEMVHMQSGRQFKLKDTLLIKPHVTVINSYMGTVFRNNENAINTFSGQFLFANSGENTYQIKATGIATINIAARARWLL